MSSPRVKLSIAPAAHAAPTQAAKPSLSTVLAYKNELTAVVLGVAGFALSLFPIEGRYLWGEAAYLAKAENLFSGSPYYTEAGLRPPLLPLLLYAGSRIMALDVFCRLLAAAFFTAAVVVLYLLGHKLYGYLAGLCAAVLMLSSPFFVFWAHKVMTEIPATALLLASIYLLFLHVEDPGHPFWSAFASGILLAAAFMTQWIAALAAIMALYFLAVRRLRLASLGYALACLVGIGPYLAWVKISQGSFVKPLWSAALTELGSEPFAGRSFYLKAIYLVAGPVALFGLLGYLYALLRRQSRLVEERAGSRPLRRAGSDSPFISKDLPILLWASVFLTCLSLVAHKETSYILPTIPALYVLAGRGFAALRYNWLANLAVVVVPVSALYMATHLPDFEQRGNWVGAMLDYSGETREAMLYLRNNQPGGGAVYSNHMWPVASYYGKRRTVALWPRDDRFYRAYPKNMVESGYFIYYRGVGKAPREEWLDQRPEFKELSEFGNTVLYSYKFTGAPTISKEQQKLIEEARVQFRNGAYDSVVEILAPIQIPDMDVANLRGWSYYRMGKINEAADAFREGLRSEPDNPRNLTGLGYCEIRNGDPHTALRHLKTALDQGPENEDAIVGLGLAYLRLGDDVAAEEQFRNALRLDPNNEEVRGYLRRAQSP